MKKSIREVFCSGFIKMLCNFILTNFTFMKGKQKNLKTAYFKIESKLNHRDTVYWCSGAVFRCGVNQDLFTFVDRFFLLCFF